MSFIVMFFKLINNNNIRPIRKEVGENYYNGSNNKTAI